MAKILAKVCSAAAHHLSKAAVEFIIFGPKQCAGYVMGKNVFNPLWPTAVHKPTFSALHLVGSNRLTA